ncbi:MAG: hypothetical protein V7K53_15995 [Nostoc sp.]|uniref:hypothetical protein n=1 Tax=Nostoc sp. TaxID=1180 RepID=UPI002FF51D7E
MNSVRLSGEYWVKTVLLYETLPRTSRYTLSLLVDETIIKYKFCLIAPTVHKKL